MEGVERAQTKKRTERGEGSQRGGSSRPGLLPARTRHDVRRGRGRPPQPVGGGCQGLAAGGALRGEPSGEVIFLGVPPYPTFTEALLKLAKVRTMFATRNGRNLTGTSYLNKYACLFSSLNEFGQRVDWCITAVVEPVLLQAPPRPLA